MDTLVSLEKWSLFEVYLGGELYMKKCEFGDHYDKPELSNYLKFTEEDKKRYEKLQKDYEALTKSEEKVTLYY